MPAVKISTPIMVKQYNLPAVGGTAVSTTGATSTTPFGFATAAQANSLVATVNALVADMTDCKQVLATLLAELAARSLI